MENRARLEEERRQAEEARLAMEREELERERQRWEEERRRHREESQPQSFLGAERERREQERQRANQQVQNQGAPVPPAVDVRRAAQENAAFGSFGLQVLIDREDGVILDVDDIDDAETVHSR
jgi:hypothetical protein